MLLSGIESTDRGAVKHPIVTLTVTGGCNMLVTDLSRVYRIYRTQRGSRLWKIFRCYLNPGFQGVKVHRFEHWLLSQPFWVKIMLRPLGIYLHQRIRKKWGIDIAPGAKIGTGFQIFHYGGIFIDTVTIGKNCSLRQDITIGMGGVGAKRGLPTLGNDVDIYPGAVIVGRIRIGNAVKIGPNVVVQRNVPDKALVQVRPAQIVTFPSLYGKPIEGKADSGTD
jgi:serine O-acetyltransferase